MNQVERVKVLSELFGLINMYYEARDLPYEGSDFFVKVENCCRLLDVDFNELKKEFGLDNTL